MVGGKEGGRVSGDWLTIHPTDRPTNERGEERENRCHKRPVKISRQMGPPLTPSLGCENVVVVVVALHACLRKREDGRTIAVNHSFEPQHIAERRREGGPHAAVLTSPVRRLSVGNSERRETLAQGKGGRRGGGRGRLNGSATKTRSNFAPSGPRPRPRRWSWS